MTKADLLVEQVDVKGAFLYGEIGLYVYVRQSKGFEEAGKKNYVLKLCNAIYELRQASKIWGKSFKRDLMEEGLRNCTACLCIFVHKSRRTVILLYVDAGLICAINAGDVKFANDALRKR